VCGGQTRFEETFLNIADDTGMNGIKLRFCGLPIALSMEITYSTSILDFADAPVILQREYLSQEVFTNPTEETLETRFNESAALLMSSYIWLSDQNISSDENLSLNIPKPQISLDGVVTYVEENFDAFETNFLYETNNGTSDP